MRFEGNTQRRQVVKLIASEEPGGLALRAVLDRPIARSALICFVRVGDALLHAC